MMGPLTEPSKSLSSSQGMQTLGGVTLILLVVCASHSIGDALQQCLEQGVLITGRVANRRGDFCSCLPASVIFLFDDVGEDESIAMPGNGPDVGGLSRIGTEGPAVREIRRADG